MSYFIRVKDFIYYNRKFFIIGLLLLFFMLFCYLEFYIVKEEVLVENEVVSLVTGDREEEVIKTAIIMVDIKGKIRNPGTYEIEENSRVIEKTTTNMIQKISAIFAVNPLISKEI